MKNYFDILQLPETATKEDIKSAYRKRAKQYHPDKNKEANAAEMFIRINEAYEFLMDDSRRKYYSARRKQTMSREEELRREHVYREWVKQQEAARQRARQHAQLRYEEFANSPVYKTANAVNKYSNYVFLVLGIIMMITPIFWYISDKEQLIEHERTVGSLVMPGVIGLCFTYGLWFFGFKSQD